MERSEWLKGMRAHAEALYDDLAPAYWVTFGMYANAAHRQFIDEFLRQLGPESAILDAACGAGRYDGMLLEPGHTVLGIDQSGRMIARAREHFPPERFPRLRYAKVGLQEMHFESEFDGAICIDALEHVCPEDWPVILGNFQRALRPGGVLYVTVEIAEPAEVSEAYERARAVGLPVVLGEVTDGIDLASSKTTTSDPQGNPAVYHYYPAQDQVRTWMHQAGLTIQEEGTGDGYWHLLQRKNRGGR